MEITIFEKMKENYKNYYKKLYDDVLIENPEFIDIFEHKMKTDYCFNILVSSFCEYINDFMTSDREINAFMLAFIDEMEKEKNECEF